MSRYPIALSLLSVVLVACEPRTERPPVAGADRETTTAGAAAAPRAETSPIEDATSAAPAALSSAARVMNWPEKEGGEMTELRKGTNDWTCYPTSPQAMAVAGKDPMCLNQEFKSLVEAWMNKKDPPKSTKLGIGYMLQGDPGTSNTDPYATAPTPDNQWVKSGPHLMLAIPSRQALDALPTDPKNGGPWVMWKGTPYAHVMVPVQ